MTIMSFNYLSFMGGILLMLLASCIIKLLNFLFFFFVFVRVDVLILSYTLFIYHIIKKYGIYGELESYESFEDNQ